jgi:thiamine-triphosphatase
MIEVEKKFSLTEDQLKKIEKLAKFVSKKTFTDVYFDDANYSLTKKDWWLRQRDDKFELKIPIGLSAERRKLNVYDEITETNKIAEKIGVQKNKTDFILELKKNNLLPFCKLTTTRTKYTLDGFIIDIDEMDFGYSLCEIEKIAESESEIEKVTEEIFEFAKFLGLEIKSVPGKGKEYLWRNNRTHYDALVASGTFHK